jgi:acetylglutamate kinase
VSADRTAAGQGPRIEMLLESLPYIREFSGCTIVIKYGGSAMADETLREAFARDVVLLKYVGLNPVIVHGGGPEISDYMRRLGLEVEFVQGLRVSDKQTVEVAKMVLIGKLNKDIVLRLNRHGQAAVGLCGDDGSLFQVAKRRIADSDGTEVDLGYVGSIHHVDVNVLNHIAEDYIPVVASVGADGDGNSYNVNADEAAGAVAKALGAYKVIFLTDVEGWLADRNDPATLVSETDSAHIRRAIEAGEVAGGMLPKLQACVDAVEAGVRSAHIVDGREPHSVLLELFTDAGIGTKVTQ